MIQILEQLRQLQSAGGPADMSQFGDIVSGYVAEDLVETIQGASITTWTDSYGTNDGTSTSPANTTLNLDGGKKEIVFAPSLGSFDLGASSRTDMNFLPTVDAFTVVYEIGSAVNTGNTSSVISLGGVSNTTQQYNMLINSGGGGTIRPTWGTKRAVSGVQASVGAIIVITYDPTIGAFGQSTIYKNGVLGFDGQLEALPTQLDDKPYNVTIGGREGIADSDFTLRGVYVYTGVLDQTAVTGIQSFLTT